MSPLYLVCEGDSLTAGTGAVGWGGTYPNQLALLYGPRMVGASNAGTTTEQLSDMNTEAPTQIDPQFDARKGTQCALIWGGTNDITNFAQTAAATYARLVTWVQGRQAVGFKVVAFTMLPRNLVETQRIAFNILVRANTAGADAICDVGGDANIGVPGANTNLTYYNADQIHLVNAGYAIVAGLAKTAVDSIVGV